MGRQETPGGLTFDHNAIRMLIGAITFLLPLVVSLRAEQIPPSISWSYYTYSRDIFVGTLAVIGALLICYKGHSLELDLKRPGMFWLWLGRYWRGALDFRLRERRVEEDWVATLGGLAAWTAALFPTSMCPAKDCSAEPTALIHYIGAIILFSTTIYFCLVAFNGQVTGKLIMEMTARGRGGSSLKKRRRTTYQVCGWSIAAVMGFTLVSSFLPFLDIPNLTFWAETAALMIFGYAWMAASHKLPWLYDENERVPLI